VARRTPDGPAIRDCKEFLVVCMLALVDIAGHKDTPMHERNRSRRRAFTWDSGRSKFGERAEMMESLVNQRGGHDALLLCRC
jgi:hypothetical protein